MKKHLLTISLVIAALLVVFVMADYFGAFGIRTHSETDFIEMQVRTLDAETGREISDVKVTCFQYGTNNACGQPPSRERGVVRIQLLVEKNIRETLLFTHDVSYSPVMEEELRIMYIHGDYQKPVQRYDISELIERSDRTFSVEMQPLIPAAERNQQTQADTEDDA